MALESFYQYIIFPWIGLGIMVFILLFFISAPYGRHERPGWGIKINNRLSWVIMEIISPLTFSYFFLNGQSAKTIIVWVFFILWWVHYFHRSLIFPFRIKSQNKEVPLLITLFAICFNIVNGFINGYYLGNFAEIYPSDWLLDFRFILGTLLFFTGFLINIQSDEILLKLRKPGESGYKIPYGGLYRYISCPNYFGECIEWTGFAILTWSLPGAAFALWTVANLAPRAISNHRWYLTEFSNYPTERKAFLPFLI